jgi:hypothetical protein
LNIWGPKLAISNELFTGENNSAGYGKIAAKLSLPRRVGMYHEFSFFENAAIPSMNSKISRNGYASLMFFSAQ